MINTRQIDDIMAIQNDLARQLIHIFFDLVMLDHDDHEVNCFKEAVQIVILISHHILGDKRIVDLQSGRKVAFLALQQLESLGLTHIVNIFLIG